MGISMVSVDVEKIKNVLANNNLQYKDASERLGHDLSFISRVIKRGKMARYDVLIFKSEFGVDVELKTKVVPAPAENENVNFTDVLNAINGLAEVMKSIDVTNKAMLEELKQFNAPYVPDNKSEQHS